jgi:hypothetical protein
MSRIGNEAVFWQPLSGVTALNSNYRTGSGRPAAWSANGQDAAILLCGIDFNIALFTCMRPGRRHQKRKNGTNGKNGIHGAGNCMAPFVPFFFFIAIANWVACI